MVQPDGAGDITIALPAEAACDQPGAECPPTAKDCTTAVMVWVVAHAGFEPAIFALRGRCPGPLDECAVN